MTNQLAAQNDVALPAHLQFLQKNNVGLAVTTGISAGSSIYQIGIKAARFRLQDPQGNEEVVPTPHLDVIIIDGNPNLSKTFYLTAYTGEEGKAPDCFSDNGVGPSTKASAPQAATCATCPKNVWGSKVNAQGKEVKACSDTKKIAVILANNPTGPVYLLKVPTMSLKNLYSFVEAFNKRNIPLPATVVRLEFDTASDYPKLKFAPTSWIDATQAAAIKEIEGSTEVDTVLGKDDKPRPFETNAQTANCQAQASANVQQAAEAFNEASSQIAQPAKRPRKPKTETEVTEQEAGGFFAGLREKATPAKAAPATAAAQVNTAPAQAGEDLESLINSVLNV